MIKRSYMFYLAFLIFFSSCSLANVIPNKSRDDYYSAQSKEFNASSIDYNLLRKVYEGKTKEDALREWGEPWKRKSNDIWVYKFNFLKNKIVLYFKNGIVIKSRSTMPWYWFLDW